MTTSELHNLIRLGEVLTSEFKRSVPADLGREICAFANAIGGHVLIGVDDDGQVVGVTAMNRVKSEVQSIARNIDPPIAVAVEAVENVLVVTVPAGPNKPYMVAGKFYMRQAATTQQLNRDEIREFFFREGLVTFDEQPCRRFDMSRDFDPKKYRAFARATGLPAGMKTEDVLRNLEVLTEDGMTNAGALFFGKRVTKFFLEAKINCAVFQGTGKTKIIDQQICEGSVVETYQAAIAYLQAHLNAEYIIRGGPRQEVLELPLDALREAVLNAIGHRDYRLTGHIQIHISLDRVEIINPGGLVSGLTLADLGRVSRPRNPLLFALMHRMELVEDVGSGIRRIRDEMRNYGLERPLIETGESWFSIAFKRKPQDASIERQGTVPGVTPSGTHPSEGVNEGVSRLLDYVRAHPGLRVPVISHGLSVPAKTIERWVKSLKQQGVIRFEGSPKKGGYHALPSNDSDG